MRLIDADALRESFVETIARCDEWINEANGDNKPRAEASAVAFIEAKMRLDSAPTVDAVEVKHRRWIEKHHEADGYTFTDRFCSECGKEIYMLNPINYCPNCGAKMDGGEDDETV